MMRANLVTGKAIAADGDDFSCRYFDSDFVRRNLAARAHVHTHRTHGTTSNIEAEVILSTIAVLAVLWLLAVRAVTRE